MQIQQSSVKQSLTDLYSIIAKKLEHHPTPESLKNKHFLDELNVILLMKKPITHTFICDQRMSVQIQFKGQKSKPLEEYTLDPFNKISTHYYQIATDHQKYVFTLNCSDKTLFQKYGIKKSSMSQTYYNQTNRISDQNIVSMFPQDESNILQKIEKDYVPHPYEPLYYFQRKDFEQYLNYRNTKLYMTQPLDKILISDWILKIVNISKTGAYSIVIQVHKYKYLRDQIYSNQLIQKEGRKVPSFQLKNVGSILYQQKFQSILQKMRLKQIKQMFRNTNLPDEGQKQEINMCYHLRNVQTSHKIQKISQFVTLDRQSQVLKNNALLPLHFIPVGEIQGMCTFPQPIKLDQKQKQEQLRQLNNFSMKALYQILNKQAIKAKKDRLQIQKLRRERRIHNSNGQGFSKMIQQRLQHSYYQRKLRQKQLNNKNSGEQDNQSLFTDSNQQEQLQGKQQENVTYQDLLNDQDSQSESSQQQNEYFRKYRQEMRRQMQENNS